MNLIFLSAFSKAINAYLKLDPATPKRLQQLADKAITIELLPFHFTFQCLFTQDGINIVKDEPHPSETKITGTPLQMASMMINKKDRRRFFSDDLTIQGNAELGQQVIAIIDDLDIDWEEYLSRIIGDVGAYHASRLVRTMGHWVKLTEKNFSQQISEYLHEEANWFPQREALQDSFNEIDLLRMDVDRIEAKINHLCASLLDKDAP